MKNNGSLVITDFVKFEEVIASLEESYKKVKDIFEKQNKNKEEINSTDTWSGYGAKAMYAKYHNLSTNFGPIDYSLQVYIKFLKKTLDDYKRMINEIDKNTNEIANSLDVNS